MKSLFLFVIISLSFICASLISINAAQQPQTKLSNKDVTEMLSAGISPEIVAAKIKASTCAFDTSPTALKELKASNTPDPVVLAMVQCSGEKPVAEGERPGILVPTGTVLTSTLDSDISSETSTEDDPITLKTDQAVIIDGKTVIAKGAIIKGRVVQAEASERRGKAGKIRVQLETVNAVDGQKIKVTANAGKSGKDSSARIAAGAAATGNAAYGALRKGGSAKIRAGTTITIYTDEDKRIHPPDTTPPTPQKETP